MNNDLLQEHTCPALPGEHLPGLHCLSDGQALPLLFAMDPETLLNCGRSSPRLYRLVCDQEVWRHLVRGVDFTEEQVEELRLFGQGLFKIEAAPEMMPEIVKEKAQRLDQGPGQVKVMIAIQKTWGTPQTFEVDGNYLEELTKVATAVGASFTITEVQVFCGMVSCPLPIFRLIEAHIAQQGESLSKLQMAHFPFADKELSLSFLQLTKEWSLQLQFVWRNELWEALGKRTENGSIGTVHLLSRRDLEGAKKDVLKKVWKISEKFVVHFRHPREAPEFGGGKGAETEAEWHRLLEHLQLED